MDVIENENLGTKVLVVNSRNDIHCWRFSFEAFCTARDQGLDVSFIDLSHLDPSWTIFMHAKYALRKILRVPHYSSDISKIIKDSSNTLLKTTRFNSQSISNFFISLNDVYLRTMPRIEEEMNVATHSWVSSQVGNTKYEWNARSKFQCFRAIQSQRNTRAVISRLLSKNSFETILTFNGRFPVDSTVVKVCKEYFIKYYLFDGGSLSGNNFNRIQYFSQSPHSINELKEKIDSYWENSQDETRLSIAKSSLDAIVLGKRALGSDFNWNTSTEKANSNYDWSKTIVFFASSDWELGAINEWLPKNGFTSQFLAAEALHKVCRQRGLDLVIKLHPIRKNYRGRRSEKSEALAWKNFRDREGVHIVGHEVPVNPIFLASRALMSAGFRTSVTAQTMYLGFPTVIMGDVPWRDDQKNFNFATNELQLDGFIEKHVAGNLPRVELNPIFKWAYYHAVCGKKMLYSKFTPGSKRLILLGSFKY